MSLALIQIFALMSVTFALGLFLGWSLWRYGGVSKAAMEDLEAKMDFMKRSLDQSRQELWNLQEGKSAHPKMTKRAVSRRRTISESGFSDIDIETASPAAS